VRDAFEYAKKYGYKTVTMVEKPNVVRETSGLMVREARKIAKEYPGIELWETNIDAMCMWLIKNPENYDVLVARATCSATSSATCARSWSAAWASPAAATSATTIAASSNPATARRRSTSG
jgi:isocitrate/isopropylmalate dehydrogenase